MRPPRRIADQDGVLADPAAHHPHRPGWICTVDGEDWPCPPLQRHMLATMTRAEISHELATDYVMAVVELAEDPTVVHRRFFGWHREGWHPPGGP